MRYIVHLDDHLLFAAGLQQALCPFTTGYNWVHFQHPTQAREFMLKALQSGETISTLITDFNHQGDNGYVFSKHIKRIVKQYHSTIPIILYTMSTLSKEMIRIGLNENVFDDYIQKSASVEEVINGLHKWA
jgi:DNA-binding NarL/FixJ family response regulator